MFGSRWRLLMSSLRWIGPVFKAYMYVHILWNLITHIEVCRFHCLSVSISISLFVLVCLCTCVCLFGSLRSVLQRMVIRISSLCLSTHIVSTTVQRFTLCHCCVYCLRLKRVVQLIGFTSSCLRWIYSCVSYREGLRIVRDQWMNPRGVSTWKRCPSGPYYARDTTPSPKTR